MELRLRLPRPDGGLVSNLVALTGLVMVVCAVAALSDWRWALLLAGGLTFATAVWAQQGMGERAPSVAAADTRPRPKAVKSA